MEIEPFSSAFNQVCEILNKKNLTASDFDFLKSIPTSKFQEIIERLPADFTTKILDYLKNDKIPEDSPKKSSTNQAKRIKKPSANPSPFLENFYAKGMFKHLWLEDVKRIHQSILPTSNLNRDFPESHPEFPSQMKLEILEKKPTFVNIVCKMIYVFGEPKQDNYVCAEEILENLKKMIEILLDPQVFSKAIVHNSNKKSKKIKKKQGFHQYLLELFPVEYKKFSQVKEASKAAFPGNLPDDFEEKDSESIIYSSSEENSRKELKPVNSEEFDFINSRVDKMKEEEFFEFSYCRSLNFLSLGRENFIEFINFRKIQENFFKELKIVHFYNDIEFINYILCRLVKRIVENAIRKINKGALIPLQKSLRLEDIKEISEHEVMALNLKIKKYIKQKTSIEEQAFRLFSKEFWIFNYDSVLNVFNTKIKLLKHKDKDNEIYIGEEEEKSEISSVDLQNIWKNMKSYQKYWMQRILAENQVKLCLKNNKSANFTNEYAIFLWENLKSNENLDKGFLFKEWFLMKIQGNQREKNNKKSLKLESIFD